MNKGVYLIIDPSTKWEILYSKLIKIAEENIAAVQIWDNFEPHNNPIPLINEILKICHSKNIPVIINNNSELLEKTKLDGIHFDRQQDDLFEIKSKIDREIFIGVTCGNDLSTVKWAHQSKIDYISFCSMFPSPTANSCELVTFDTIKKAAEITSLPIFLAGGILPENLQLLDTLDYSGIAVVSGIMNAENPIKELKKYQEKLKIKR